MIALAKICRDADQARVLREDSLALHTIFAMLGVGLLIVNLIEQHGQDPLILNTQYIISYASLVAYCWMG